MLKKDFTVNDIDGNKVNETWYFNLSVGELTKMHLIAKGDLLATLQAIVKSGDGRAIIEAFEDIIRRSVGKRGPNNTFIKSQDITDEFMGSEAYSDFFVELVTKADVAAEFVNNVIPGDLAAKAKALQDAGLAGTEIQPTVTVEATVPDRQPLTIDNFSMDELVTMTREDLDRLSAGQLFDKPGAPTNLEDFTREQLLNMSQEQFNRVAGTDSRKWDKKLLIIAMQRRANRK